MVVIQDHLRTAEKFQHDKTHAHVEYSPGEHVIFWRALEPSGLNKHLYTWWTGPYVVM